MKTIQSSHPKRKLVSYGHVLLALRTVFHNQFLHVYIACPSPVPYAQWWRSVKECEKCQGRTLSQHSLPPDRPHQGDAVIG